MADTFKGKRILVDIQAYRTPRGPKYLDLNFSGVILEVTESHVVVRRDDTGITESLLGDEDDLEVAEPGDCVLRSTGARVPQPDFIMAFTRTDVADVIGHGYGTAEPDM